MKEHPFTKETPRRRVKADSPAALAKALDEFEADGEPRILERNGRDVAAVVPINRLDNVLSGPPSEDDIKRGRAAFGAWADIDTEALKKELREARRRGSRPVNRP